MDATKERNQFSNNTHLVVSKIAYLIGVPYNCFERENIPLLMEIYQELNQIREARVIRNLSMIRTCFEKYFSKIDHAMMYDMKNIDSMPEYIPPECERQLRKDGVSVLQVNCRAQKYLIDINALILKNIDACKDCLPLWVKWEYIRDLFIMPNGNTEAGLKRANQVYHDYFQWYPYQMYLNANLKKVDKNILYSDETFMDFLYAQHGDYFEDQDKVKNISEFTKDSIYEFIHDGRKIAMVVDCENSDPYKLYAVLTNLQSEALSKISKMILIDDIHTTDAWEMLKEFTTIKVEHILIPRVLENKSLVDPALIAMVCRYRYQDNFDSFILFASDSDYWALIQNLPDTKWLTMIEYKKCSPEMRELWREHGIFYCYIDNFCTGNSNEIKTKFLLNKIQEDLDEKFKLDLKDYLEKICSVTKVQLSATEKTRFLEKYIKSMHVHISREGIASIQLGMK